jgi:predicted Fe-Mo cluster-binding NifX family protein
MRRGEIPSYFNKLKFKSMNKRIAIPLEDGVLCAHFGHCQEFAIVEVVNGEITEIKEVTPPEHVPGLYPRWVAQFGVTDVIGGGMGQKAIDLFNEQNINAFVGAPAKTARELVGDFIENKLNLTANYCNHDGNHSCNH